MNDVFELIRQIPQSERPRKFWAWLDEQIACLESIDRTEIGEAHLGTLREVKDKGEFYNAAIPDPLNPDRSTLPAPDGGASGKPNSQVSEAPKQPNDLPTRLREMATECERQPASGEFIRSLREAADQLDQAESRVEALRDQLDVAHGHHPRLEDLASILQCTCSTETNQSIHDDLCEIASDLSLLPERAILDSNEAFDRAEQAEQRASRLEEALAPFAALAEEVDRLRHGDESTFPHRLKAADIRHARDLLSGES